MFIHTSSTLNPIVTFKAIFAKKMKQKVLESDDVIKLKPLNGRDRRLIHKFFEEDGTITSTSIGDGAYKVIELRQK